MGTLSLPPIRQSGSETTNGQYRHDRIREQVADWVKFALQTRHDSPLSRPLTIHLDQLLGTPVAKDDLVRTSFLTFRVLIEQMEAMGIPDMIMPSLYIPLECAETFISGPFSVQTLIQQINHNQPPSLYLTERADRINLWAAKGSFEQYAFPLQASDFLEDSDGVSVYYNATRSLEDIKNGWEYGRAINAEYYSEAYRLP